MADSSISFCLLKNLIFLLTVSYVILLVKNIEKLSENQVNLLVSSEKLVANPEPDNPKPSTASTTNVDQKIKILIVAEYRGGSTFTSELFNKNPHAAFLFEPFVLGIDDPIRQTNLINDIFYNCSLPNIKNYLDKNYTQKYNYNQEFNFKFCKIHNVCFRSDSRFLNDVPFCYVSQKSILQAAENSENSKQPAKIRCDSINYAQYNSHCQEKIKFISAKVVRLSNFKILDQFIENDPNFFVLYVIRDPRGIFSSRDQIHRFIKSSTKEKDIASEIMENICQTFRRNLEYIREKTESNKTSRYNTNFIPLRYEDFSTNPSYYINKIYQRLGDTSSVKNLQKTLLKETHFHKDERALRFGTNRNSTNAMAAWRNKLNIYHTQKIQEYCGRELMGWLGYKNYRSAINQKYASAVEAKYFYDIETGSFRF